MTISYSLYDLKPQWRTFPTHFFPPQLISFTKKLFLLYSQCCTSHRLAKMFPVWKTLKSAITNMVTQAHTHGCKSATAWTHSQCNTGQETHHADSTALKWGTWFISFQSWIVMPYNTSLSLDIQLWGKDPQHGTKPQLWFHNFNFPYRFQGSQALCGQVISSSIW